MKKKIIIGLSIYALIFFLTGVYIIITIETTTSKLDNLIKLHQVEILREHLLINISGIQSGIQSKNLNGETLMAATSNMEKVADACFKCHHKEDVKERLLSLRGHVQKYEEAVSGVVGTGRYVSGLDEKVDKALKLGEALIVDVNNMITKTSRSLDEKTRLALKKIESTKIMLYATLVLSPALATMLIFILIRSLTNPINTILNATRRLKSGELDYRIERLKDEFGEVAKSFNEMAGSLKEQMLNMQRTEQLRVCGELATGLAHEIKNPLAGIKVSMEVLHEDASVSEENREVLFKVIKEIKRIEALLKELLIFARPPKPQLNPTNINNIIDNSLSFANKLSPNISFIKDLGNNLSMTMADQMQLQQIFLNLMLNAVDAMPDGGTLTIRTSEDREKNSILVEMSDTGRGIKKDAVDKIFQPFFTTKPKGTGMGLAIAKRIVEEHGGNIHVKTAVGEGTTFGIVFPIIEVKQDA